MGQIKNIKLHIVTDIKMLLTTATTTTMKTIIPMVAGGGRVLANLRSSTMSKGGQQTCYATNAKTLPTLTLYSKAENCSLCDDAKAVIFKYGDKFNYEEVDITNPGNEVWFDLYKYDIPVVHINNVEVMRHYVFDGALLDALHNAQQRMANPPDT